MRKILFRGRPKCKNDLRFAEPDGFVYGYYCPTPFGRFPSTPAIYPAKTINSEWYPVEIDPETLGQYTGKVDKNSKKVFEGDLLRVENIEGFEGCSDWCVEYFDDGFVGNRANIHIPLCDLVPECSRIIGNIYDNPELL